MNDSHEMNGFIKFAVGLLGIILGLCGLLATLCGGYPFPDTGELAWVWAWGSIVVGVLLIWLALRWWWDSESSRSELDRFH